MEKSHLRIKQKIDPPKMYNKISKINKTILLPIISSFEETLENNLNWNDCNSGMLQTTVLFIVLFLNITF